MENLSYLLIITSRYLKNSLDKRLSDYNVTASQFSVLNQIALKSGEITLAQVADNLKSDRPTISGIINRLEDKGFLTKIINKEDKRSSYLKLTDDALEMVSVLRDTSDKLNMDIFSDLDKNELDNLKEYLINIIEKMDRM